jgi:hypothetical protein
MEIKRGGGMPVLYRCKICGREHLSPAAFVNKEYFESASVKVRAIQCQATGRSAVYGKNDMRWKG